MIMNFSCRSSETGNLFHSATVQVPPELAPVALFHEQGGNQGLLQVMDPGSGHARHCRSAAHQLSRGLSEHQVPDNLRRHCHRLEAELGHEKERVKSLEQELERARAADLERQRQRVAVEAEWVKEREELKRMSEESLREREHCCALQAGMQARLDAALQEIDDLRSATAEQQQQQAAHMCGPAGGTRAAAAETVGHACSVTRTMKEEQEGREEFLYCDSFEEPDFSASAKSPKTPPRSPIWGSGPSPDHQRQDRCRQPDSTPWQGEYERNKMEEAVTEAAVKRRSSDWVGWALKVSHGRHGGSKHGGNKRREVAQARGVKKADVTGT